jgi:hypothetical protein
MLVMDENVVLRTLQSFPAGSSGGPDGLRPQHLLEMVCCKEPGPNLLAFLTAFLNLVLSGSSPSQITPLFFGARLIALGKKSGGVRPTAVGCVATVDCQLCCFLFRYQTSHIFQSSSVRHWYLRWM